MNAPHLEARRWFQEAQADLAVVRTLQGAGHHLQPYPVKVLPVPSPRLRRRLPSE